jgi:8-oxo-dGTP diphosphatase
MFTSAWAAAVDRNGRVGLGSTGRCPLPAPIAAAIRQGGELGPLVDALLGETDTKQRGGASGAFTAGLVERRESLAYGVLYALAPFLSPQFFGPTDGGRLSDLQAALDAAPATAPRLHYAYTVCFVRRPDGAVLFLERTRPPNAGWLNGLGGKVDPGEDLVASARREIAEESGLATEPRLGAVISLWAPEVAAAGQGPILLFLFVADVDAATAGQTVASGEGTLHWVTPAAWATAPLVPNIRVFLPPLLAQPPNTGAFSGTFWYNTLTWQGPATYVLYLPGGVLRGHLAE